MFQGNRVGADGFQQSGCLRGGEPLRPGHRRSALDCIRATADDQHRAMGMVHRMAGYRAQQHPGEAAMATRSDHQEIRPRSSFQKHFGGMALPHFTGDRNPGCG